MVFQVCPNTVYVSTIRWGEEQVKTRSSRAKGAQLCVSSVKHWIHHQTIFETPSAVSIVQCLVGLSYCRRSCGEARWSSGFEFVQQVLAPSPSFVAQPAERHVGLEIPSRGHFGWHSGLVRGLPKAASWRLVLGSSKPKCSIFTRHPQNLMRVYGTLWGCAFFHVS